MTLLQMIYSMSNLHMKYQDFPRIRIPQPTIVAIQKELKNMVINSLNKAVTTPATSAAAVGKVNQT